MFTLGLGGVRKSFSVPLIFLKPFKRIVRFDRAHYIELLHGSLLSFLPCARFLLLPQLVQVGRAWSFRTIEHFCCATVIGAGSGRGVKISQESKGDTGKSIFRFSRSAELPLSKPRSASKEARGRNRLTATASWIKSSKTSSFRSESGRHAVPAWHRGESGAGRAQPRPPCIVRQSRVINSPLTAGRRDNIYLAGRNPDHRPVPSPPPPPVLSVTSSCRLAALCLHSLSPLTLEIQLLHDTFSPLNQDLNASNNLKLIL